MRKVGEFWVPDIDTHWFRNRTKTEANFAAGGLGRDIGNLDGAIARMAELAGAEALARSAAIDAGANVGAYARRMAQHFAVVHALEPAPDTFECLARNVQDWGLAGRIIPHAKAVSAAREGVAMGSGGFLRRSIAREVTGPGDIPAIPLDDLGLTDCLFLKLDVEGYELKALEGAARTVEACRPFVMMEVKERHLQKGTVDPRPVDWLEVRGYRVVANLGNPVIDRLFAPSERIPAGG